jgi:signal transduction histidine kinase
MELIAVMALALAMVSVLTVRELEAQRELVHMQDLAKKYAVLLDDTLAQSEAKIQQHLSSEALAEHAQELVVTLPWLLRLEQHDNNGHLLWSHVFIEPGSKQPLALPIALIATLQEGATQIRRVHFSELQTEEQQVSANAFSQIHLAWPLSPPDRFGLASWSIPKLLAHVNVQAKSSLGIEARLEGSDTANPNQSTHKQWVQFGSTGVKLPLEFMQPTMHVASTWQTYAVPLMAVSMLGMLGLLYRETQLRQQAEGKTREQQERVQTSARLATLGEIATMISHEINQPLAAIETYAATCERVLAKSPTPPSGMQQALSGIRAQAERAGRMIHSVQDFAQSRKEAPQGVDVMIVLRELATLIDIQAKRFKAIVKVQGVSGLRVQTDKTMIEQVLLNLIRNGLEAMQDIPEGKRLLEVGVVQSENWLVISVADAGSGVPLEIRDRLFMPFVTNKPQGVGIGLSLCKSLVEKFRGRINYAERAGGGSVFTVHLPFLTMAKDKV